MFANTSVIHYVRIISVINAIQDLLVVFTRATGQSEIIAGVKIFLGSSLNDEEKSSRRLTSICQILRLRDRFPYQLVLLISNTSIGNFRTKFIAFSNLTVAIYL